MTQGGQKPQFSAIWLCDDGNSWWSEHIHFFFRIRGSFHKELSEGTGKAWLTVHHPSSPLKLGLGRGGGLPRQLLTQPKCRTRLFLLPSLSLSLLSYPSGEDHSFPRPRR